MSNETEESTWLITDKFAPSVHYTPIKYGPLNMIILPRMGCAIVSGNIYYTTAQDSGMKSYFTMGTHFRWSMQRSLSWLPEAAPYFTDFYVNSLGWKSMYLIFPKGGQGTAVFVHGKYSFIPAILRIQRSWRRYILRRLQLLEAFSDIHGSRLGKDIMSVLEKMLTCSYSNNSNVPLHDVGNPSFCRS